MAVAIRGIVFAALVLAVGSTSYAAPVLVVNGSGKLTGARNVDVGGQFYDVDFVEGNCIDLFSGCDAVADFFFQSAASAQLASQSLLDTVFVDGPLGAFDSTPTLTSGCVFISGLVPSCIANTPYGLGVSTVTTAFAVNTAALTDSIVGAVNYSRTGSSSLDPTTVWAKWQPAASVVPEPSPLEYLVVAGLTLLAFSLWRRRLEI